MPNQPAFVLTQGQGLVWTEERIDQIIEASHILLVATKAAILIHHALVEETIPQHFASIVSRFGDRNAVISRHQNSILTYAALDEQSNSISRGLQSLGVKKGDRVAVSLGNNLEFASLTYG